MKTAAVVVTYNRKDLLIRSIQGILTSTRPIDRVFVVDNNSNDGTSEIYKKEFGDNEAIVYTRLDENTGSAGGFNYGVKQAYEWGADWIWFLDDDVSPTQNCLETMLGYEHLSKCIHPSKKDINGREFMWESIFNPSTASATILPNISFKNNKDFTFVNMGCFEGMLIHRDVVSKIGFPDERFFIAGDDVIYGFLASLHTNVIFVRDAVISKLIPLSDRSSPTFLYYSVRNQFLMKKHLQEQGLFNGRLFYLYLFSFVLYAGIKQAFRNRSTLIPVYVIRGLIDGVRGRFYKL